MTTIKPLTGGINLEVWHIDDGGYALINIGPLPKPSKGGYVSEQAARYPVAELLAALDAVPRAEVVNELREARAERDALAATVERVREVLDGIGRNSVFVCEVRAALDPKPAFVLPTEAGVRFYAEDPEGDSFVFKTLIGGREPLYIADDDQDQVCNADELTGWQNFRLLDGAE